MNEVGDDRGNKRVVRRRMRKEETRYALKKTKGGKVAGLYRIFNVGKGWH